MLILFQAYELQSNRNGETRSGDRITQHAISWIFPTSSASSVYNYRLAVRAANTIAFGNGEKRTEYTGISLIV